MFKLLVILYIIKLYAQINIYKHIKKKHGQDVIRNVRLYEKLKTKYMKINADIKYIKSCKKEELTPHFAKVNLALGGGMMVIQPHVCVCRVMECLHRGMRRGYWSWGVRCYVLLT